MASNWYLETTPLLVIEMASSADLQEFAFSSCLIRFIGHSP